MSRFGRLLGRVFGGGRSGPPQRGRNVQGRYEGAETTHENEPLWRGTDYLSARAANSFQVRKTLKIRSRYEAANNSYFRGITNSLSNDLIGSGPRIQVRSGDVGINRAVQNAWHNWARAIGLADKLRLMAKAKVQDGEAFGLLVTNRNLARTFGQQPQDPSSPDVDVRTLDVEDAVQLDVVVIESDQVTTPDPGFTDYFWVDGLVLDRLGNPAEYHVLRHHPGDLFIPQLNPLKYDRWRPRDVCHWFRKDRPGQARGVPELTPALDLFAQLRRFTKAVLAAAEAAADMALFMKTQVPANVDPADPEPFERLQLHRGMLTTLPWGTDVTGLAATQPATTYEMFVRVLLREICRCLGIPLTIAMGDFSGSNYSSGRLEHLGYHRMQRVDRQLLVECVLDKILAAWLEEAVEIPGLLPDDLTIADLPHRWFWDSAESINPLEEQQAQQLELQNGTKTLSAIYAEKGEDWRIALRQTAEETAYAYKLAGEFQIPVEALLHKAPEIPAATPPGSPPPTDTKARFHVDATGRLIRAGKDDNGVEHAADGKFGSGGGSAGGKGHDDHAEHHDRWSDQDAAADEKHEDKRADAEHRHQAENDEHEKAHQKIEEHATTSAETEDKAIGKARDREDADTKKTRAKEDQDTERQRAKEDKEREAAEKAREREDADTKKTREREDKDTERQRTREDAAEEKRAKAEEEAMNDEVEAADKQIKQDRAAEHKDLAARQEQEKADLEKQLDKDGVAEDDRGDHRDELEAKHDEEREGVDEKYDQQDQEAQAKYDARYAAEQKLQEDVSNDTTEARDTEDEGRQAQRDKEDADREAKRQQEDDAWEVVENKRSDDDDARQQTRDEADEKGQSGRDAEDEALDQKRSAAADARQEEFEKAQADRDARHQAELDQLDQEAETAEKAGYEERKKEHAGAHDTYYSRKTHEKYGRAGTKTEARRRAKVPVEV
ncbi:MAG: phage portal protein lambda family [Gemmataceae bacterium]|nr:phage portal protein lambda family [Gemmataceae bacterium]